MSGEADFSQVEAFKDGLEQHVGQAQSQFANQVYESVRSQTDGLAMQGATVVVIKTANGARVIARPKQ